MNNLRNGFYGDLAAPTPDPADISVGQVHLGLGAFHRAHQAVYAADAMTATGDTGWGIAAFTQRRPDTAAALAPQDSLYTVVEYGAGAQVPRVLSAVREAHDGSADPTVVVDRICDPAIKVVTLTVTEKGYRHDPVTRTLGCDDPAVRADLAAAPGATVRTVPAILAHALARRAASGADPLTVVSCDNLPDNGRLLGALVTEFAAEAGLDIGSGTRFPATVVDRIVPATTADDIAALARERGLDDAAPVVCEPFRQWVIEREFAGPTPDWAAAGATYVDDANPWELLKLRVLNASHSLLAYTGLRLGYRRIADAIADPNLEQLCRRFIGDEVAPSVHPPAGTSVTDYGDEVLARFANRALPHTTWQVAADGTQKLGPRLLDTIRACRSQGVASHWAPLAVGAWTVHVQDPIDADGHSTALDDPLADDLREVTRGLSVEAGARRLLGDRRIVGDLAEDHEFINTAAAFAAALHRGGAAALASEVSA